MRKTALIGGCVIVFFLLSSSAAAILSSSYHLKGTLDNDTNVFFIGKTHITGNFTGIPMARLINSSIVGDMRAFPLIGTSSISDLDTVIVAEDIDITTVHSLEELYLRYSNHLTQYSDVELTTNNGLFLLGISQGSLSFSSGLDYAVTSFLPFEITPGITTRFFLTATPVPLTMQLSGDSAVLTALSNSSTIQIKDTQGVTLWSGDSKNNYLLIQDTSFSVIQQPPLFLFPQNTGSSNPPLQLVLSPADSKDIIMKQLMEDVVSAATNLGNFNTSEFMEKIHGFDAMIQTTALVDNAAMILLQANDTVTIDHTMQRFSAVGFARFNTLDVTSVGSSSGPTIQADCKLIFLGDHFYNPQAKRSSDGISFPFELLIIWILALCIFLAVHFFIRPDVNEDKNDAVKRYALLFHVILLIIAVLLLDSEINDQFGLSAITALATQGISMISCVFLLIELLIGVLGYVMLALPVRLLVTSGLRFLGIGKGGRGVGKGIGDLSIWIFCALYVQLFINIFLSLFHFSNLLAMG